MRLNVGWDVEAGLVGKRKGSAEWAGQERVMGISVVKIRYIRVGKCHNKPIII